MSSLMRARNFHQIAGAVLSAGAWLALVSGTSYAQSTATVDDLRRCAEIANDTSRLACFDRVTPTITFAAPESNAPAAAAAPQATAAPPSAASIAAFGSERVLDAPGETIDEIQSRLIGELDGWSGETTFTLENGQVWQQAEAGRLVLQANAPLVTIRRGAFGSYRLSVEGVNRAVRVRRVR
jgi:hypothetical protein